MPEIGRERHEVASDVLAAHRALRQRARREGMAQVMDARAAWPIRRDFGLAQDHVECGMDGPETHGPAADRQEHMIVHARDRRPDEQIRVECRDHACVHRHEPALVKLGLADVQHTVRQQIAEPQVQGFRDAQARCGEQSDQHRMDVPPERARFLTPQIGGGVEHPHQLVGGVDIRCRPDAWTVIAVMLRDLMGSVLSMQEAGEVGDFLKPSIPAARRRRDRRRPGQRRRGADMAVAIGHGMADERDEVRAVFSSLKPSARRSLI